MSYWGPSVITDEDGNIKFISYGPNGGTAKIWSAGSLARLARLAVDIGPGDSGQSLVNAGAWFRPEVPLGQYVPFFFEISNSPDVTSLSTNRLRVWARNDKFEIYGTSQNGTKPSVDFFIYTYGNNQIVLLGSGDLVLCGKTTIKKNGNIAYNGGSERSYIVVTDDYVVQETDPDLIYFAPDLPNKTLHLPPSPPDGLEIAVHVPTASEKGTVSGSGELIEWNASIEAKPGTTYKLHYTTQFYWTVLHETTK